MAELEAVEVESGQWRRRWLMPVGRPATLGRLPEQSDFAVPEDGSISRRHAELRWEAGRLLVHRLPDSKAPVYVGGEARDDFSLGPGEHFVISRTRFAVIDDTDLPTPLGTLTCSADELRRHRYVDPDRRLEALATLPSVIRFSPSEAELERQVVAVLLKGVSYARVAAVVCLAGPAGAAVEVRTTQTTTGLAVDFRPSRRLVREAIGGRRSVMHTWQAGQLQPDDPTVSANLDWAICSPVPDDPVPGWGLYVAGKLPGDTVAAERDQMFKSDLKFAELAAEIFGNLRQVCHLRHLQGKLGQFLPQQVVNLLAGKANIDEVLQPRAVQVTVLFCDIRGFSRKVETGEADLLAMWKRINEALAVMSGSILDHGGTIADFQGDAAMGFWGWPEDAPNQVELAAQAALSIGRRFAQATQDPGHPLHGLSCGLGLAHGPAVAGRLGTLDQYKIDVFGHTVNLASRLEGMTKMFGASILADEACVRQLADTSPGVRCRRLACVRPAGMNSALTVTELLPPLGTPPYLTPAYGDHYHEALADFQAGRWDEAQARLAHLRPDDKAVTFLLKYMHEHRQPSPGWDGTITLETKG